MDRRKLRSLDLTQRNIEAIAELFPQVIEESWDAEGMVTRAVDFDLLRQELSDHVVEGPQERYQLDWPGKRAAAFVANTPIAKTLRPVREESVEFDTTKNLFIEGDNLDALKLLQESYLGKVKLIYIDPPYNTGNDFVYEDDFTESTSQYLQRSGQESDSGNRLVANPESNGRFHSDWLSMMYPRLKLARNLLRPDGAIFISIDDNEMANLVKLGTEVFGTQNFVGAMVWAAGRKNDSRFISASHEYILCFARNISVLRELGINWKVRKKGLDEIYRTVDKFVADAKGDYDAASRALKSWYAALPDGAEAKRNKHYARIDQRGVFFPDNISWPGGGGPKYEVLHPVTGKPVVVPSRGWLFQPDVMRKYIADDRVLFGPDENSVPTFKRYLRDTELEVAYSVFYQDGRAATKRLRELMEAPVFDFPKDETVIQTLVEMTTSDDDLIVDFFAGSGTTAHAVLAANVADGGRRHYIMVQLGEGVAKGSGAEQAGYATIAEIARERIRRAAAAVTRDRAPSRVDSGFRALRVDSTNMVDVEETADDTRQEQLAGFVASVRLDRTEEDLLFQVLLDWGLDLSLHIAPTVIDGSMVWAVDGGALLACFADDVTPIVVRAMAERRPLRAVFKDSGFAADAARINAEQIFREVSPETEVRTI